MDKRSVNRTVCAGHEFDLAKRRLIEPLEPIIVGPTFDVDVADSTVHPLHEYRVVTLTGYLRTVHVLLVVKNRLTQNVDTAVDPFGIVATVSETATPKRKIAVSRKAIFPNELLALLTSVRFCSSSI